MFIGLDAAALFLPGAPPRARDSAAEISAALLAHRSQLLAATYAAGLAVIAYLAFVAALRRFLSREGDDREMAATAFIAGGIALVLQLTGFALFYGATYKVAAAGQDALVRALTDAGNAALELSKFGFAGFIGCLCLAAPAGLSRTFRLTGYASAVTLVLSAVSLVSDAPALQFGGPTDLLGGLPAVLWLAWLSALLIREAAPAPGRSAPAC